MTKNYFLKVLETCSEHQFGQDAIEWAIISGWVKLTGDLKADTHAIMGQYDDIIEAYRRRVRELEEQTTEAMQPLIEEILRPLPLTHL